MLRTAMLTKSRLIDCLRISVPRPAYPSENANLSKFFSPRISWEQSRRGIQEGFLRLRYYVQQQQKAQRCRQRLIGQLHNQPASPTAVSASDEAADRARVAERRTDIELALSAISLGFAVAGTIAYPPLTVLSIPWFVYGCIPMFKDAYAAAQQRRVTVDTLSSFVAVTCLFGQYYIPANFATTVYYVSRKLLQKVKRESRKQVIDVFRQQPKTAWLLLDDLELEVPFAQIKQGDIVVVSAGGFIPADGTIVQGAATIDQHILTGESQPAEKGPGTQVFASTVVMSGRICIKVEQAGQDTIVAQIGRILNETAEYKSSIQLRSEQLTNQTILPTLIVGGVALPFVGPYAAAAFLNSHYKYKMNIVAPVGILTFLNLMSQHQILIKDGRTLDLLNQVDTLVFDKTGTLTKEQPTIEKIHTFADQTVAQVLTLAATAEQKQTHPIAQAIRQEAGRHHLPLLNIDESAYKIGYGLSVRIDGQLVRVGSRRFMEMEGLVMPAAVHPLVQHCNIYGHSLVMVARDTQVIGAIELRATVRTEAQRVICGLRKQKQIRTMYIISGDHEVPTKQLAQELGIDHYFAETLPETKANLVEQLQAEGKFVCYVGDGINDSIALKKSQVSISLRGASTVATDTAQIILMDGNLDNLLQLFQLAKAYDRNAKVGFATQLVPMSIGMAGALFFHLGLGGTILISYGGLMIGVLNSLLPLVGHRKAAPCSWGWACTS